jgi:hypothetical protein
MAPGRCGDCGDRRRIERSASSGFSSGGRSSGFRVPVQSTGSEYRLGVPARSTCSEYRFRVPVQSTGSEYLFGVPVRSTRSEFRFGVPVQYRFAVPVRRYPFRVPVQSTGSEYVFRIPVQSTGSESTGSEYRFGVPVRSIRSESTRRERSTWLGVPHSFVELSSTRQKAAATIRKPAGVRHGCRVTSPQPCLPCSCCASHDWAGKGTVLSRVLIVVLLLFAIFTTFARDVHKYPIAEVGLFLSALTFLDLTIRSVRRRRARRSKDQPPH